MKYAAAITLYNPTQHQIVNCIEYKHSFDCVYILDNTDDVKICHEDSFLDDRFVYIRMQGNEGLSKAFNIALNHKDINNYDFLCTLDQDSIFSDKEIKKMCMFIEECAEKRVEGLAFDDVGIFAPVIDYGKGVSRNRGFEDRKRVITSGSFVRLKTIKEENIRYDENYFIDKFEIDFCQQLILKGKRIVVFFGAKLCQQLGDGDTTKHSMHSPLRHYYLFRNRFYYNHKFYHGIKKYGLDFMQTIRHLIEIVIYEPDKINKIRQLGYGYSDYKKKHMGKRT